MDKSPLSTLELDAGRFTTLYALFDGVIAAREAEIGDIVRPGRSGIHPINSAPVGTRLAPTRIARAQPRRMTSRAIANSPARRDRRTVP